MPTVRILSIDGGGIRGILPAFILKEILDDRKVGDVFHIVAGTSTGALIAAGLAKPNPLTPTRILDIYKTRGAEIFSRSDKRPPKLMGWIGPKYTPQGLEAVIEELVGDTRLSAIDDVDLMIASYCVDLAVPTPDGETQVPFFFRSAPAAAGDPAYDFHLRDICRATSAAPTYFPAARATSVAGSSYGFVDGGLFANNPSMCALAHAFHRFRDVANVNYQLISLGTGFTQSQLPYTKVRNWGPVNWVKPLISVLMDGSADTVGFQLEQLLRRGENYWRFDIPLGGHRGAPKASSDLDDATPENITALMTLAQYMADKNRDAIATVKQALAVEKDVV
jgi:uncharacterized protein